MKRAILTLAGLVVLAMAVGPVVAALNPSIRPGKGKKKANGKGRSWQGRSLDTKGRKAAPAEGFIDNQADWEKLWKAWRKGDVPDVAFDREIVVVAVVNGPNVARIFKRLGANGNLTVRAASTKMGGPGFGYGMMVVSREGVKSVNGHPVPPPGGAGAAAAKEIALTEADDGKAISAVTGQKIVVTLKGNPTTGYTWKLLGIETDAVKQVGKIAYAQRPAAPGMVGVGGAFTVTFEAAKAGKAKVELGYLRPWEKGKAPIRRFTITVEVRKAPASAGQAVTVSLDTPSTAWSIRVQGVYEVGKEIWVVSKLASAGIGGAAITRVTDTVNIAETKLPVRHYVLGKTWNWGKSTDTLTYVTDEAALNAKLKGAKKVPFTR